MLQLLEGRVNSGMPSGRPSFMSGKRILFANRSFLRPHTVI